VLGKACRARSWRSAVQAPLLLPVFCSTIQMVRFERVHKALQTNKDTRHLAHNQGALNVGKANGLRWALILDTHAY